MGFQDRDYVNSRLSIAQKVSTFSSYVYSWLTAGLSLTAVVAYFLYASGLYVQTLPFWWVFSLATLGISFFIQAKIESATITTMGLLMVAYAVCQGLIFGSILPVFAIQYGGDIIWVAFASSAAIFATAALYGRFTKSDLTQIAKLLNFGVIALLVLTLLFFVASFFMKLTWANLLLSYVGLAIFTGLIITDSNQIQQMSRECDTRDASVVKYSLIMALRMYINVIMVFWYLLQILSSNRDSR